MKNACKVLSINSFNFGSTGNIMLAISQMSSKNGYKSFVSYPASKENYKKEVENYILISNRFERNLHLKIAFQTGRNGCYSKRGTGEFLNKVTKVKPDIIHLHNLHNCYINLAMLFSYIKENNISVVWTLHDCWAFTGQCPHFTVAKCEKWKTQCHDCPQYRQYPASRIDKTNEMFLLKKKWFTGIKNLTIVTPSEWLKDLVEESYLKEYPVKVINNGIDLNTFKPIESDFREKNNLVTRKILLGVASSWGDRKGLNVLIDLSKIIDFTMKIVIIGLSNEQILQLPQNILGIKRTSNARELAEIYSAADVFVNPTFEDTYPTTNLESIACGTPVITFNTGGSVEVINKYTGRIVQDNTVDQLLIEINLALNEGKSKYIEDRIFEAQKYDKDIKFKQYIRLYKSLIIE